CASLGTMARRKIQLGRLWWPRGAQRFSIFHTLVDTDTLAAIRAIAEAPTTYTPQPLVLSWVNALTQVEVARIQPSMYMLPARPLAQHPIQRGLSLLTLCDERFLWWYYSTGALTIDEGTTTWDDLITTLGSLLGVVITRDTIPDEYLFP